MLIPIDEVLPKHFEKVLEFSVQFKGKDSWEECPPVPHGKTDLDSAAEFAYYMQKHDRRIQYRIMVEV